MKAFKTVWNILTTLIVIAVVLLAVALAGVRVVGLRPMTVLSGSMEPTYHTGSLIYVKKVDYKTLKEGDVITFMLDEDTLATHRITAVIPDPEDPETLRFRTKGDANDAEDGAPVHYKNVVGSPVFSIPKLGYVADYIQNPPGTYIAISVGAIALLLLFLPELIGAMTEKEETKEEKKEEGTSEKEKE